MMKSRRSKPGSLKKGKLANLKGHLYRQLLSSLCLIHISRNGHIEIREQMGFTRMLYGMGLCLQTLKLLHRPRGQALENGHDLIYLEIPEFKKLIVDR